MALDPQAFYKLLQQADLKFFTGVPDSLLKDFLAYVTDNSAPENHIITANEGNAIALASGYHLATGKFALVYMQNSGLGNCINPLTSLADSKVYSIPILLLIGWRAEPGKKDESQHLRMGKITLKLLKLLGIKFNILSNSIGEARETIKHAVEHLARTNTPYGLVVKENTFDPYQLKNNQKINFLLNREEALKLIIPLLENDAAIVSTTGKTSRELFEIREKEQMGHHRDFLTVGSMGHASSIALGIALSQNRPVYCFDGDGALLMHLGSLSTIGKLKPKNFRHIVFNNFTHDSVGGQPTAADAVNFTAIARASSYRNIFLARTSEDITNTFANLKKTEGPSLVEIECNKGSRTNLGRPTRSTFENKNDFMNFLQGQQLY